MFHFLASLLLFSFFYLTDSYSVDLRNPQDIYRCRGDKDYDLRSFDFWDIYASGRLQTNLCRMTFESEAYPYSLMVEISQPIRANPNSKFYILFQTKSSSILPWGGDTKLTANRNTVVGPLYFDRRLAVTISGDSGEDVSFRIRIRTRTTNTYNNVGVVSGLANWAIGVIVACILVFFGFLLCGVFLFRRYRASPAGEFSLIPGYFSRAREPYAVTYSGNNAALLNTTSAPQPIYLPNQYPQYPPPNQPNMYGAPPNQPGMYGAPPPHQQPGYPPPPPAGFIYPPGQGLAAAPPPYSQLPPK